MKLENLTNGERVIGAAGILLVVDLLFFPWHSIDTILGSFTRSGVESPNGFWGVLALLVTIAIVVVIALAKLADVALPRLPIPWAQAVLIACGVVAGLLVLKLVVETTALGFGAWFGIVLGAGMAYGGYLVNQEGFNPATTEGSGGAAPGGSFCGSCGNPVPPGSDFCPKCGAPVGG